MTMIGKIYQLPFIGEFMNAIPTLIIHGKQDKAVPLDRSKKLNDLWKGSKLVIFDKAGHSPHEEYLAKFNQLALEFLAK